VVALRCSRAMLGHKLPRSQAKQLQETIDSKTLMMEATSSQMMRVENLPPTLPRTCLRRARTWSP